MLTRWLTPLLLLLLPFMALAGDYRDRSVPIGVVANLDLDRYLGKWYEIARYPNRFERNCQGVTAEYSRRPDGKIRVLNTCHKGSPTGPVEIAEGQASIAGPGKLDVTFVPWLPFAKGDYWVLHVDPGYQMAVVGEPKGRFGWILSRAPEISDATYARALAVLERNGYDTSKLELVRH